MTEAEKAPFVALKDEESTRYAQQEITLRAGGTIDPVQEQEYLDQFWRKAENAPRSAAVLNAKAYAPKHRNGKAAVAPVQPRPDPGQFGVLRRMPAMQFRAPLTATHLGNIPSSEDLLARLGETNAKLRADLARSSSNVIDLTKDDDDEEPARAKSAASATTIIVDDNSKDADKENAA
ncbi:hypothetical protein BU26DRAFT_268384 [Trematosphaeria pertusa]|uniref:Uncharacterized protein n=1 Tax=Trematosphaeria pertusa TaxID=390896 RepID=A0A6A6IMA4_9PLEO|nr:uncharacterized protein BU26DRAFT_268384 [Trematosphaeria pertusa]KAF2250680.1 hypothetical protein BU26DRAFT_268384 [Trematosphaeria pertusa]